jgi:hypothetical protein
MSASAAIADSPLRQAWTRLRPRPGRRARCSVGQHTVSSMPPSRRGLGSEACLAHSYKGASPLVKSPRRGHAPFGTPRRGVAPPRGSARLSHVATARFRDKPSRILRAMVSPLRRPGRDPSDTARFRSAGYPSVLPPCHYWPPAWYRQNRPPQDFPDSRLHAR